MANILQNNTDIQKARAPVKKRAIYYIGKFEHEVGRQFSPVEIKALADDLLEWMDADAENLWVKSFFNERRIKRETIAKLRDKSEYFAALYEIALDKQEERILLKGLQNKTSAAVCIFMLKAQHRWSETPPPAEEDDHELIVNWPDEGEMAEAAEMLKDERLRDAMLLILKKEETERRFGAQVPHINSNAE
jgi:hypothetical protein